VYESWHAALRQSTSLFLMGQVPLFYQRVKRAAASGFLRFFYQVSGKIVSWDWGHASRLSDRQSAPLGLSSRYRQLTLRLMDSAVPTLTLSHAH